MTNVVANILKGQLQAQGSDFAMIEDAVHCVLRLATDRTINGQWDAAR